MPRATVLSHLLATLLVSLPLHGQAPPDPGPTVEAMRKVSFLAGRWEGSGWFQMGPGPKEEFTQSEVVEPKLDGAILLVEGIGTSKANPQKQLHHALAVIAYDPVAMEYRFSTFVAGRPPLSTQANVGENTFIWAFQPQPNTNIRYTITVNDGTWHEIGEYSADAKSWRQFFEMRLKKL